MHNQYTKYPSTAKLLPYQDSFWVGTSPRGILNYPTDFFDFVRNGMIKVHVTDIECLKPGKVILTDGQEIDAEALISCTGWKPKPPLTFLPAGLETTLGLTSTLTSLPPSLEPVTKMLNMADTEILTRFPHLKNQPIPKYSKQNAQTNTESTTKAETKAEFLPELLTRFIAPPVLQSSEDHTLAFAGHVMTISTTLIAQAQ